MMNKYKIIDIFGFLNLLKAFKTHNTYRILTIFSILNQNEIVQITGFTQQSMLSVWLGSQFVNQRNAITP